MLIEEVRKACLLGYQGHQKDPFKCKRDPQVFLSHSQIELSNYILKMNLTFYSSNRALYKCQ